MASGPLPFAQYDVSRRRPASPDALLGRRPDDLLPVTIPEDTGGGMESGPGGGDTVPVVAHPDLPPGTIFAHCEKLPEWCTGRTIGTQRRRRSHHTA